jgi:hypothetical protein
MVGGKLFSLNILRSRAFLMEIPNLLSGAKRDKNSGK